jgi:hypothetical protein
MRGFVVDAEAAVDEQASGVATESATTTALRRTSTTGVEPSPPPM